MRQLPQARQRDKRSGSAIILSMLFCVALLPMIGLAVDGANVYMTRTRIGTAMNAAVLAGTRSLSVGMDVDSQKANATAIALATFNANVSGMGMTVVPSFNVVQTAANVRSVVGTVSVTVPLMLMGLVVHTPTVITVSSTAKRRDVNIVMVLENSGAMNAYGLGPLTAMQTAAQTFVSMFSNGRDNVGLVVLDTDPFVAEPLPNLNFRANVPADIVSLAPPAAAATNTAAAMWAAYQQIQNLNQPGALNVIVLFTHSLPGAFTGNFAGLVKPASTYCDPAASPLNGVLWTMYYGAVGALADPTASSINDTPEVRWPLPGCTAATSNPQRFLLTAMPSTDINGNSTNGTGSISALASNAALDLTAIDATDITMASENAFDDAANRIRSDTTFAPVIYAIGLGGDP